MVALNASAAMPKPLKSLRFFALCITVFFVLGLWHSRGQRFDPAYLHQNRKIRICLPWATGSGFSFPCMKQHSPVNRRRRYLHDTAAAFLLGGLAANRGAPELEAFPFLLKFRNLLEFSKLWE